MLSSLKYLMPKPTPLHGKSIEEEVPVEKRNLTSSASQKDENDLLIVVLMMMTSLVVLLMMTFLVVLMMMIKLWQMWILMN